MTLRGALLAVLLLIFAAATGAQDATQYPEIVEIQFEGNKTTQPKIMRREMVLSEGDPADPALIERSRQGIQDLGLFRRVSVRATAVDSGVKLTFTVREKYYILPLPRLAADLDGRSSVGGELRWNNLFGLNHSLRLRATRSELQQQDRGKQTSYVLSYVWPFAFDSPYTLRFSGGHTVSPVIGEVSYDETFDSFALLVSRTFPGDGPASQGWTFGLGPAWQNERRGGEGVPPAYGEAAALVAQASFRDIRFRVFSEEGVAYGVTLRGAREGLAADYDYSSISGGYSRLFAVGETAHQNINLGFDFGAYFDGPDDVRGFALGGSSALRNYKANFLEGNAFYLFTAEYVRPIGWPWLRAAAILEAGNVFGRPQDFSSDRVYTSAGLALRLRLQTFVNLEIEFGYAVSLDGGSGRVFGGRI